MLILSSVNTPIARALAVLFFAFICVSSANAYNPLKEKLPDCPVVPGATWYWIGQSMVVNDLPMSVKYFEFSGDEDAVVAFYTNYWRTNGHGAVKDQRLDKTRIISQELDGFFTSVQIVSAGKGVTGKIVVSLSPAHAKRTSKTVLPMPPGSTTASRVLSQDGPLYSETLTLIVDRSVDFTWSYYQNQLANAGWTKVKEETSDVRLMGQFQSPEGLLQITIKPLPGSSRKRCQILVHWMK